MKNKDDKMIAPLGKYLYNSKIINHVDPVQMHHQFVSTGNI